MVLSQVHWEEQGEERSNPHLKEVFRQDLNPMHNIQNLQGSATSRTKTQQGSNKPYLQDPHTV